MKATKAELRREIQQLRHVGQQLSNVAFNLSQTPDQPRELTVENKKMLKELYKEYDAIKRAER